MRSEGEQSECSCCGFTYSLSNAKKQHDSYLKHEVELRTARNSRKCSSCETMNWKIAKLLAQGRTYGDSRRVRRFKNPDCCVDSQPLRGEGTSGQEQPSTTPTNAASAYSCTSILHQDFLNSDGE